MTRGKSTNKSNKKLVRLTLLWAELHQLFLLSSAKPVELGLLEEETFCPRGTLMNDRESVAHDMLSLNKLAYTVSLFDLHYANGST